jgi:hypothetical protein
MIKYLLWKETIKVPNWNTHLEIARRINQKLKYEEEELEQFYLGSILPDINCGYLIKDISKIIDRKITHFEDATYSPTYKRFNNKYKEKLKEAIFFGYYVHLYTDYRWNERFHERRISDERIKDLTWNEQRIIKQADFRVYDDLLERKGIKIKNIKSVVEKANQIEEVFLNEEDVKKVENYLNNREKVKVDFEYYTKEQLDKYLENTVEEVLNQLV